MEIGNVITRKVSRYLTVQKTAAKLTAPQLTIPYVMKSATEKIIVISMIQRPDQHVMALRWIPLFVITRLIV
ncbi:hypothetical protein DRN63_02080 [Nanoarchaeota archaeon]|nr:MAG: hypothetical protein DRN63_02080 [Nanoarchaeota archaeon]